MPSKLPDKILDRVNLGNLDISLFKTPPTTTIKRLLVTGQAFQKIMTSYSPCYPKQHQTQRSEKSISPLLTTRKQEMLAHLKRTWNLWFGQSSKDRKGRNQNAHQGSRVSRRPVILTRFLIGLSWRFFLHASFHQR